MDLISLEVMTIALYSSSDILKQINTATSYPLDQWFLTF